MRQGKTAVGVFSRSVNRDMRERRLVAAFRFLTAKALASVFVLLLACPVTGALAAESVMPPGYPASRPVVREEAVNGGRPAGKPVAATAPGVMSPDWKPLFEKLKKDGVHGNDIDEWFARLDSYSEKPMGTKISSVFQYRYRPFRFLRKPRKSPDMLTGVFTPSNVEKCALFLRKYPKLFAGTEKQYKADKEIVVSLLMVETRLGTYMGNERAFWSLACMSLADNPGRIKAAIEKLYLNDERRAWIRETMRKRSDWAYKELVAFIGYCRKYKHDPLSITGSAYGAIGLPQFMPSNIPAYAADGNKDGKINLFMLEDAVPSIANYLKAHGWRPGLKRSEQHRIIRRYNHSDMYANTVLALADGIREYNKAAEAAAKAQTPAR